MVSTWVGVAPIAAVAAVVDDADANAPEGGGGGGGGGAAEVTMLTKLLIPLPLLLLLEPLAELPFVLSLPLSPALPLLFEAL